MAHSFQKDHHLNANHLFQQTEKSIGRLCKYLLGAPTETARNILKDKTEPVRKKGDKPNPRGHGKNGAGQYTGAARVRIAHPALNSGDPCPSCEKGKLYELAMPSVFVHIVGTAPLKATVYERIRLRCNLCGDIFTPELPEGVSEQKYDDSATPMLAILKYGCGMPFNRIETLQRDLGQPLPASTQWGILDTAAVALAPVMDAMVSFAAQGTLLHNDDTSAKVLAFLKEQDPDSKRKGIFTTGMVTESEGHQVAMFMTGRQHAGENLHDLLKRRATGLPPPIQMCDALSRNVSKDFQTILANCLAHARRKFVELVDRFPDDCAHVINELATVYMHEAIARSENMSPEDRLAYHRLNTEPVMTALEAWCHQQFAEKTVEPNSGLGKAITYLLKHWKELTCFLKVPGAPLDNNICERALKFAILHRKNSLFYKTQRGAYVGDLFMSLIHTCQLSGVNPLDYLTWLLKNTKALQTFPHTFMPWHYQDQNR